MTLVMVLVGGWFFLSAVCFAMGAGLMRPRKEQPAVDVEFRSALHLPAPRVSSDADARIPAPV